MNVEGQMKIEDVQPKFTGEFFVPGESGERIEADHYCRYEFACHYVKGKSVLDIACGAGYSSPLFVNAGAISYDGVDLNQELIAYSNKKYGSDIVRYHTGNICTFDEDKLYDVIVCFETIEHVAEYELALKNLHKLLNPNGILLISSPNRPVTSPKITSLQGKPANKFHTQEFIPEELVTLLNKHGFIALQTDVYGQRQTKVYSNRLIQWISRLLFGSSAVKTSPQVAPITNKTPRYFVALATKA